MMAGFVRFYITIMATFVAMFGVCVVIIWSDPIEYDPVEIAQAYGPGLRLARERVEAAPAAERNDVLKAVAGVYHEELVVVPWDQLDERGRDGLSDRSAVAFWIEDLELGYVAIQIDSHAALRLGPLVGEDWSPGPNWLLAAVSAALVFGLIVYLLLRPLTRHLRSLQTTALAVGEGHWDARVELRGDRHQLAVARAFNTMVERLEALVESRTTLLRSASHELRTPLSRLRFRAELLQNATTAQDRERHARAVDNDIATLDDLVDELLTYARAEAGAGLRPIAMDLDVVLREIVDDRHVVADESPIHVVVQAEASLQARADRRLFARAIGNLVDNALRHANTRVLVSAQLDDSGHVRIAIEDDGPGIPEELRARAFEPFDRLEGRSTEREDEGIGLGLAIVDRIVKAHDGEATVLDSSLGGCAFVTRWPYAEPSDV